VELDDLSRKQADVADACGRIFKALNPLLKREGIHELNLEQMIFSRISKGVVMHLPIRLGEKITKKDLYTGAHAVGVLANTTAIFDRLSQTALAPDVYLVKVRAIRKNAWAFDFMQADGRRALSTPANLVDERAFESISPEVIIYVHLWGCDVYVGPDPDGLMRGDGSLPTIVCVSFGAWVYCFGSGMF
jgi:hypothetical protein